MTESFLIAHKKPVRKRTNKTPDLSLHRPHPQQCHKAVQQHSHRRQRGDAGQPDCQQPGQLLNSSWQLGKGIAHQ